MTLLCGFSHINSFIGSNEAYIEKKIVFALCYTVLSCANNFEYKFSAN
jgi:hypothetical protein